MAGCEKSGLVVMLKVKILVPNFDAVNGTR